MSSYRLAPALAARILGFLIVVLGVAVMALTAAVAALGVSGGVLAGAAGVVALLLLAGLVVFRRRVTLVELGDDGYRIRWIRGAGVTQARWTDVEDVVASTVTGERCVLLRLRDGRTTTVPVRLLAGSTESFLSDLRTHLDSGHGYRRLV